MSSSICSCGSSERKLSQSEYQLFEHFTDNPDTWWHGYKIYKFTGIAQGTLYRLLERSHNRGVFELKTEVVSSRIRKLYRLDESHMDCLLKRIENYEAEEAICDLE